MLFEESGLVEQTLQEMVLILKFCEKHWVAGIDNGRAHRTGIRPYPVNSSLDLDDLVVRQRIT